MVVGNMNTPPPCCRHCGWPGLDHQNKEHVGGRDRNIVLPGREISLQSCRRFDPEPEPTTEFARTGRATWWGEAEK